MDLHNIAVQSWLAMRVFRVAACVATMVLKSDGLVAASGSAPGCPSFFMLVLPCCEVGAVMFFERLHLSGIR
jgi:hypothetical protein